MQFKRGRNAWQGWTYVVVEADCCLHFLCFAEATLAFHSTRVQVETSYLPSLIKVIKNDFYALRVIEVYLYEPNIID